MNVILLACPVCNNSLYLKPDNEIKCLVWHNKDWKLEEMHHADESDGCDYNMQTKTYWFDYLSSGDDLANTISLKMKWVFSIWWFYKNIRT